MRNNTHTNRWHNEIMYKKDWIDRSEMLLSMFQEKEYKPDQTYTFSEFGCGPYAPFSQLCSTGNSYTVKKYDVVKWDNETHLLDLNYESTEFPSARVSVFSGVLEYTNDVENTLKQAMKVSEYMLVSYYFLPLYCLNNDNQFLEQINVRINSGVRNHHTQAEIISLVQKIGVISGMNLWVRNHTNHLLLLIRNFNVDNK